MITVKGQADMDRFIVSHIINPSDPKIEFKNITFDCKMIKDASGNVFIRQRTGKQEEMLINKNFIKCPNCGADIRGDKDGNTGK